MQRLLHEIQGMQVVTLAEGRIMGLAQKVYLNPARKTVSGMLVKQSGFGGQDSWISIQDVEMIGVDVLFIKRAANCKAKNPVGRSLKDLMGMPVATKDGKILGSLVDVEIDEQWRVVELSLSEGRIIPIDPRHAVFGQDTILLKEGASDRVRATPGKKSGFLARLFGSEAIEEAASAISRVEQSKPKVIRPTKKKKTAKKKTRSRKKT